MAYTPQTWVNGSAGGTFYINSDHLNHMETGIEDADTRIAAVESGKVDKSLVDAKGDLILATAADTVARLAVGTNGHVLTADSAETTGVKWAAIAGLSEDVIVHVTADGTTDVSSTIQTVLDSLASSNSRSYNVVIEPTTPHSPSNVIYLNGKVRITTSHTRVQFKAPIKLGTGCDPDGFGCLSILGTAPGSQTVTAGATRGNTVITVGSTTGLAIGQLVRIHDNNATNNNSAGDRQEMAEILEISGTNVTLNHPLHHTFSGTVTLVYLNAVVGSGFEDVQATFSGQQAAAFVFPAKMQWARGCYFRNCHFKGDLNNSWSRECINVRNSYRCAIENCSVSFAWNHAVGSTYSYGFTVDGSTEILYAKCHATLLRHGFSADRGSCDLIYSQCESDSVIASGFDLHGSWVRDVTYVACRASAAPDGRQANDTNHYGFLAGNTTFTNGCQNITYVGCVARNFVPYTTAAATNGSGSGFGVVDGCANVVLEGCRVYDSQQGVQVLSQVGQPITNIGIYDCEFNNIVSSDAAGRPPIPIYVNAGVAPNDVNGVVISGCRVVNSSVVAAMRIYGTSSNTIADITISNNNWNLSQGVSGVHSLDCRYIDRLIIKNNTFNATRRGVALLNCSGALVTDNVFANLTEPGDCIRDSGGNTNMIFADNFISPAPSAYGTSPTSTGAYIDITDPKNTPTASRPTLTAGSAGVTIYNPTTGLIEVWNGSAWVGAGGGSGHTIQDEGSALTARTGLNFVGAGVSVADDSGNNRTNVTISGATSPSGIIYISESRQADAGTAINEAIAALPVGGGTIIIPAGTWTINTAVLINKNGVTIAGVSNLATFLQYDPAVITAGAIKMADTTQRFVCLRDFTLDATGTSGGDAIIATYFVNSVIERIRIGSGTTFPLRGIVLDGIGTYYNTLRDLRVQVAGVGSYGILFDNNANSNWVQNARILGDADTVGVRTAAAHTNTLAHVDCEATMAIGIRVRGNNTTLIMPYLEDLTIGLQLERDTEGFSCIGGYVADCVTTNINDLGAIAPAYIGMWQQFDQYTRVPERPFQRTTQVVKDAGANTATALGTSAPTLSGNSSVDSSSGAFMDFATSTTTNNTVGAITAFTVLRRDWDPTVEWRIRTGASNANIRILIGLFSASPDTVPTPTSLHGAWFRYDTSVDGTAFWRCVTGAGSTPTVTTTTEPFVVDIANSFKITMNDSLVDFRIDDRLIARHTATLPGETTLLGWGVRVTTLTTASKNCRWGATQIRHD